VDLLTPVSLDLLVVDGVYDFLVELYDFLASTVPGIVTENVSIQAITKSNHFFKINVPLK